MDGHDGPGTGRETALSGAPADTSYPSHYQSQTLNAERARLGVGARLTRYQGQKSHGTGCGGKTRGFSPSFEKVQYMEWLLSFISCHTQLRGNDIATASLPKLRWCGDNFPRLRWWASMTKDGWEGEKKDAV